jgi:hypothetical protein
VDSCLLMGGKKGYEGLRRAAGTMGGSGGPWGICGTLRARGERGGGQEVKANLKICLGIDISIRRCPKSVEDGRRPPTQRANHS